MKFIIASIFALAVVHALPINNLQVELSPVEIAAQYTADANAALLKCQGWFDAVCSDSLKVIANRFATKKITDCNSVDLEASAAAEKRLSTCAKRCIVCSCKDDAAGLVQDMIALGAARVKSKADADKAVAAAAKAQADMVVAQAAAKKIADDKKTAAEALAKAETEKAAKAADAAARAAAKAAADAAIKAAADAAAAAKKLAEEQAAAQAKAAQEAAAREAKRIADELAAKKAAALAAAAAATQAVADIKAANGNLATDNFARTLNGIKLPFAVGTEGCNGGNCWKTTQNVKDMAAVCGAWDSSIGQAYVMAGVKKFVATCQGLKANGVNADYSSVGRALNDALGDIKTRIQPKIDAFKAALASAQAAADQANLVAASL